ncbi:MAG: Stp1/IreP family PP2C-type Ser/Thr phosphatase [Oscillospiraceae bacterium]|nr:Stp1/IreP family PP2C-type Ser/Thr phosphatase [Oscillospiraceae bacterium]
MTIFGISDRGAVRRSNQDSFRFRTDEAGEQASAVLCDGMGGAKSGEIASSIAAETFLSASWEDMEQQPDTDLADIGRESAAYANLKVYDRAYRDPDCQGMGTTLVAVLVRRDSAVIVNIGDSRGYWFADGHIQQVTRDHSHVQELVDMGFITQSEARSHPRKNLITRAVGLEKRMFSDIFRMDLHAGDRILLCSDGLSNLVTEQELSEVLSGQSELEPCCRELLKMALDRGAPDNVTIVLLER